jgi:hypothetical protein
MGSQGSQGLQGLQGEKGPQGLQGITGAGSDGAQGLQGFQGRQGTQGTQGTQGFGGAIGYYGYFLDLNDQPNNSVLAPNVITYDTTIDSSGVSVQNNSEITFSYPGVYNVQFSFQLDKTDGGVDSIDIWLSQNGSAVSNSNTRINLTEANDKKVAAWNFIVTTTTENEYIELYWYSADVDMRLH